MRAALHFIGHFARIRIASAHPQRICGVAAQS